MCQKVMRCNSSNLRRHLYKHFHYRPFKCGYCEYKGLSTSEVIQHTVSHGDGVLPKSVLSKQPVIEGLEDLVSLCIKSCRTGKTVTLVSDSESPLTRKADLAVDNSYNVCC
ncbi:uncharacterized protein [Anabrus simplex]|uniref:uncharacterized protein n=1 Tax=Anabrus simplex TaxID=316456 RepID=UPI0035A305A1